MEESWGWARDPRPCALLSRALRCQRHAVDSPHPVSLCSLILAFWETPTGDTCPAQFWMEVHGAVNPLLEDLRKGTPEEARLTATAQGPQPQKGAGTGSSQSSRLGAPSMPEVSLQMLCDGGGRGGSERVGSKLEAHSRRAGTAVLTGCLELSLFEVRSKLLQCGQEACELEPAGARAGPGADGLEPHVLPRNAGEGAQGPRAMPPSVCQVRDSGNYHPRSCPVPD